MSTNNHNYLQTFKSETANIGLPNNFCSPFSKKAHPLALLAAQELQEYLIMQNDWEHNFGLNLEQKGTVIGKMFGVLVVQNQLNELYYLAAFSGKLAGSNTHKKFVPPVFDSLEPTGFLSIGMAELNELTILINKQESADEEIQLARTKRAALSKKLQNKLFDNYLFYNQLGESKSLRTIFNRAEGKNPPSAAGECTAPKLLQYAFQNGLKPLAIAEFWWGQSPKSAKWKHKKFYPACQEKCAPILGYMLAGLTLEDD